MKIQDLILLVCLIPQIASAQQIKLLEYKPNPYGGLTVTPLAESVKGNMEGKAGQGYWDDNQYVDSIISNTINKILSDDKLKRIHPSTAYHLHFNSQGEVIRWSFTIKPIDTLLVPEKDIYKLYTLFMAIKFDTTKVRVVHPYSYRKDKDYNYAFMGGSIVPLKYRKQK